MSIIERLKSQDDLTPVECELVRYILENQDKIINLNISDLAAITFTSNATIVRLCRKIGLSGYRQFKVQFIKEVEKRRKEKSDVDINHPFGEKESEEEIIKRIADLSKEAIDTCYESIDSLAISKVAKYIINANSTYIYASGDSLISSIGFANRLSKLKINTVIANQYGEISTNTYNVTRDDVALFVSYSGKNLIQDRDMRVLKRSGCKILIITADKNISGYDGTIIFPNREAVEGKIATYYSQIAINYILNCIYAIIFASDFRKNYNKKYKIEKSEQK